MSLIEFLCGIVTGMGIMWVFLALLVYLQEKRKDEKMSLAMMIFGYYDMHR